LMLIHDLKRYSENLLVYRRLFFTSLSLQPETNGKKPTRSSG